MLKPPLCAAVSVMQSPFPLRFTSLVWGPFVIFMWELAIAILCCPGLVVPGFLRKRTPTPARPPIAPPVRAPVPPVEEALLQTGSAVVGDLESLESMDIDAVSKLVRLFQIQVAAKMFPK